MVPLSEHRLDSCGAPGPGSRISAQELAVTLPKRLPSFPHHNVKQTCHFQDAQLTLSCLCGLKLHSNLL